MNLPLMPVLPNAPDFMLAALENAYSTARRGNLGVGAVLVLDNEVVAAGGNEEVSRSDPFAHAEIQAVKNFLTTRSQHLLKDATLYTTFEPCPMCLGACLALGIETIAISGRRSNDDVRWGGYTPGGLMSLIGLAGPQLNLYQGLHSDEAVRVRSESIEKAKE